MFNFPTPESLGEWYSQPDTLRTRLQHMPPLNTDGLRDCQITAITKLEDSFKQDKPRALVQMATGSGKTFTAITATYRLLKHAGAKRILFLVDTINLGEQAEQEFMAFLPNDDNRKFTELYSLQRLKSSFVATDTQVSISTIQRKKRLVDHRRADHLCREQSQQGACEVPGVSPGGRGSAYWQDRTG